MAERWTVDQADCLDWLAALEPNSVDAMVTDPPAGISFLGAEWDGDKGGRKLWVAWLEERMKLAHRALKPGGHAVVWALPRTSHWTGWALESAGFEIRDVITALFGTGYPHSHDVSKALDKRRDDLAAVFRVTAFLTEARDQAGKTNREMDALFGFAGMACHWTTHPTQPTVPTPSQWVELRAFLGFGDSMDAEVARLNGRKGEPGDAWGEREVVGSRMLQDTSQVRPGFTGVAHSGEGAGAELVEVDVTRPASEAAQEWEGWGTGLKTSCEFWWLVRKPLVGTVAVNVEAHGVGGLNVDACQVPAKEGQAGGRWPPHLLLVHAPECERGSECVPWCPARQLDEQSGVKRDGTAVKRNLPPEGASRGTVQLGPATQRGEDVCYAGEGGASRLFPRFRYVPKASTRERQAGVGQCLHPTVKPLDLMRWLCRLVTPPRGLIVDPFTGSGTTGCAAMVEGFQFAGCERDEAWADLARKRIGFHAGEPVRSKEPLGDEPAQGPQLSLFA